MYNIQLKLVLEFGLTFDLCNHKVNFDFPNKMSLFGGEKSWKCCGFGLFSCWNLWFHEKNCQKNLGEKLVKMLGICHLTFRIVCVCSFGFLFNFRILLKYFRLFWGDFKNQWKTLFRKFINFYCRHPNLE